MSGHSKWHNIKVKKLATDAKRGKIYTRHAKLIELAARSGGDPVSNPSLRTAIDNAKADNVPNDNIDRAIKKGTGELKGDRVEEVLYEAYGPEGSAFIIECLTDNKNRTLPNIKIILSKNGGRFAEGGSVLWMFERKGEIIAAGGLLNDELELELIDLGATDIERGEDGVRVLTTSTTWNAARDLLKRKNFTINSAGLTYVPKNPLHVDDETMERVHKLMDALDEEDDVSAVHTNAQPK